MISFARLTTTRMHRHAHSRMAGAQLLKDSLLTSKHINGHNMHSTNRGRSSSKLAAISTRGRKAQTTSTSSTLDMNKGRKELRISSRISLKDSGTPHLLEDRINNKTNTAKKTSTVPVLKTLIVIINNIRPQKKITSIRVTASSTVALNMILKMMKGPMSNVERRQPRKRLKKMNNTGNTTGLITRNKPSKMGSSLRVIRKLLTMIGHLISTDLESGASVQSQSPRRTKSMNQRKVASSIILTVVIINGIFTKQVLDFGARFSNISGIHSKLRILLGNAKSGRVNIQQMIGYLSRLKRGSSSRLENQ